MGACQQVNVRRTSGDVTDGGYFKGPGDALEDLDMRAGSVLSLKVTGEQSHGRVTVLEGVVRTGGPPLHVHDAEDEVPCRFITIVTPGGIEDFFRGQRDYLATLPPGTVPDPSIFATLPGAQQRRVVGPPLTERA